MKLGLTCISEILKDNGLSFKTMTRKSYLTHKNNDKLMDVIKHNFHISSQIVYHCVKNNISHYRISSSLLPLVTDTTLFPDDGFEKDCYAHIDEFKNAVKHGIENGMTFSSHPGQFVVLSSKNPETVTKSIRELEYHANLHNSLGLPKDLTNPINVHLSLSVKDETVELYKKRFYESYARLSDSVTTRLTLENEDKGDFNAFYLHQCFGDKIALCYDNLHNEVNPSDNINNRELLNLYIATWPKNILPLFHLSEQGEGLRRGSHADYISRFPEEYTNFNGRLEVEVKRKDYAILKLKEAIKNTIV